MCKSVCVCVSCAASCQPNASFERPYSVSSWKSNIIWCEEFENVCLCVCVGWGKWRSNAPKKDDCDVRGSFEGLHK